MTDTDVKVDPKASCSLCGDERPGGVCEHCDKGTCDGSRCGVCQRIGNDLDGAMALYAAKPKPN